MNDKMQRHIHNMKKSAGLSGNGAVRYEYILDEKQLVDTYLKRMDDLGYPLRVEPKRDRFVMNSKALQKTFEDAIAKTFQQFEKELYDFVYNDVMEVIEQETYILLNSFNPSSGKITNRKPINRKS